MVGITLADILQNWLNWFDFLFLDRGLLIINRLYEISVNILRWYKDVYVNSFFACTARL